jgi:hypothetical protein
VRAADVNFDEGGEYAGLTIDTPGGSSYLQRSEVQFPSVRPDIQELGGHTVRMVGEGDVKIPMVINARGNEVPLVRWHEEKESYRLSQQAMISRERPPTPPHPLSDKPTAPRVLYELKLMRTRPTYENISVFVGNGKNKSKGLRGLVVGWHESKERAERLAKLRKRGKDPKDDQAGILLTIRPAASTSVASMGTVPDIPIEQVYHELYVLVSLTRYLG